MSKLAIHISEFEQRQVITGCRPAFRPSAQPSLGWYYRQQKIRVCLEIGHLFDGKSIIFKDNLNYHVSTIKHDAWICITVYTVYTYIYILDISHSTSPLLSHCYPRHTMLLRRKAPATAALVSASPAAMAREWMASENLGKRHWNSPTFIQFWGYFNSCANKWQ